MKNINFYPRIAKCCLAALWCVFILSLLTLVVSHNFKFTGPLISFIKTLSVMLAVPCFVTIQYFYDSVEKVSKKYRVTISDDARRRIAPLTAHLKNGVLIGCYPSGEVNAFAISAIYGDKALIAFSSQLLKDADDQQLMSIAAHEIAHLRNGDSRNKSFILAFSHALQIYPHLLSELSKNLLKSIAIALGIAGIVALLIIGMYPDAIDGFKGSVKTLAALLSILAWPVGMIVAYFILNRLLKSAFFAYSREREFNADLDGAKITSREEMIAALSLLGEGEDGSVSVFDTHPPLEERKKRLKAASVDELAAERRHLNDEFSS